MLTGHTAGSEAMMKTRWLASAAAILVATPVLAADLPTKKSPPVVAPFPTFSWTGCYVGAHAGGGWGDNKLTNVDGQTGEDGYSYSASANNGSGIVGGQVGCDYQFAGGWVVGAQGAASWTDFRGTSDPFFEGKYTFSSQTDWIASGTGRVGYAWDKWLFYAKGGAAWAGDKYNIDGNIEDYQAFYQGNQTRFGWTVGGGVEWAFLQHWSANVEYAYYDFGSHSPTISGCIDSDCSSFPIGTKQNIQTVTIGINYHF